MKLPGYCGCNVPERAVHEGILSCEACGEAIADPLLLQVLAGVLALRRQVTELEVKLTEPKEPAPEWLAPKEVARLLGMSQSFVYRHADELGATRVGAGPKPRLLFRADSVSSPAFRRDWAEDTEEPPQNGQSPG